MTTAVPETKPTISPEDWEIWLGNPVTQYVLNGMAQIADLQAEAWKAAAWAGQLSPIEHARCTALADVHRDLSTITYEQALGANGEEPPE